MILDSSPFSNSLSFHSQRPFSHLLLLIILLSRLTQGGQCDVQLLRRMGTALLGGRLHGIASDLGHLAGHVLSHTGVDEAAGLEPGAG